MTIVNLHAPADVILVVVLKVVVMGLVGSMIKHLHAHPGVNDDIMSDREPLRIDRVTLDRGADPRVSVVAPRRVFNGGRGFHGEHGPSSPWKFFRARSAPDSVRDGIEY